jgi:hypothetical protein
MHPCCEMCIRFAAISISDVAGIKPQGEDSAVWGKMVDKCGRRGNGLDMRVSFWDIWGRLETVGNLDTGVWPTWRLVRECESLHFASEVFKGGWVCECAEAE